MSRKEALFALIDACLGPETAVSWLEDTSMWAAGLLRINFCCVSLFSLWCAGTGAGEKLGQNLVLL